jgi:hypothetical protein
MMRNLSFKCPHYGLNVQCRLDAVDQIERAINIGQSNARRADHALFQIKDWQGRGAKDRTASLGGPVVLRPEHTGPAIAKNMDL